HETAVEREVIEVAPRAAGVGRVLGILVRRRRERELPADDLLADPFELLLDLLLLLLAGIWLDPQQDMARTDLSAREPVAVLVQILPERGVGRLGLGELVQADTVGELLAHLLDGGTTLVQQGGQILPLLLELLLHALDLLVDLGLG